MSVAHITIKKTDIFDEIIFYEKYPATENTTVQRMQIHPNETNFYLGRYFPNIPITICDLRRRPYSPSSMLHDF